MTNTWNKHYTIYLKENIYERRLKIILRPEQIQEDLSRYVVDDSVEPESVTGKQATFLEWRETVE
jgi:hypothetical protein